MAHVDSIWFNDCGSPASMMRVYVALKPAGKVIVEVDVPPDFYKIIMKLAQTAADHHEAKMQAELLSQKNL